MTAELFETVVLTTLTTMGALTVASVLFAWAVGGLAVVEAKDRQARNPQE